MSPFGPGGYFLPPPTTAFTPGGEISADPVDSRPRVIVTGSRAWTDEAPVRVALTRAWRNIGRPILVVHGGATGADRIADDWAREHEFTGIGVRCYPADWAVHGRAAGPLRNKAMLAAGAVLVLAFPIGESRGTRGCVALAEAAGIPVVVTDGVGA